MTSTTTTNALPAWVADTCPSWCQQDHQPEHLWADDAELHVCRFGDDDIAVGVVIGSDGRPRLWDVTVEGFDADHPDDLDDAAATLRKAAAWIRETVQPTFSTAAPGDWRADTRRRPGRRARAASSGSGRGGARR